MISPQFISLKVMPAGKKVLARRYLKSFNNIVLFFKLARETQRFILLLLPFMWLRYFLDKLNYYTEINVSSVFL